MAATGSNHKERRLAQPPGSVGAALKSRRPVSSPFWVAAVLLAATLFLVVLPAARGTAETASAGMTAEVGAAAEPGAPIVPILFPLEQRVSFTDTFGAPRSGGRTHAGNDLMAPKMTPILAVVDGTVDWLNLTGKISSYNNYPYYNLLLRGDDGNDYFYVHLNNDTPGTDDGQGGPEHAYAPGLTNGSRVKQGQVIGYVGDSGNAEDSSSHLHFEIHLGGYVAASAGQTRAPSAIDPYPSLMAAPTLGEWIQAGRPPLTSTPLPGGGTTTTTVRPSSPTTTVATSTTTTTTSKPSTSTTVSQPTTTTTNAPSTSVPGFVDVRTGDWFYPDFAQAQTAGVVTEEPDKRFRPYEAVSRALFTAYLVRGLAPAQLSAWTESAASHGQEGVEPTFRDVPAGYWAFKEIEVAARLGLVRGTGDGTTFCPDKLITRAQMATMVCRALGFDTEQEWVRDLAASYHQYNDVPPGYWAQGAISLTKYLGLMVGDEKNCFRPLENANRAQAITVVARLLRLVEGGSGS